MGADVTMATCMYCGQEFELAGDLSSAAHDNICPSTIAEVRRLRAMRDALVTLRSSMPDFITKNWMNSSLDRVIALAPKERP
jgi:hypothetical protein